MRLRWKLIAFEIILELILELAPAGLSLMATVSEYLVELSLEASRSSIHLIARSVGHQYDSPSHIARFMA